VLNQDVIRALEIPKEAIERVAANEQEELERREKAYRGDRPPARAAGRTAILVDDGLATGSSMRAAVQALKQQHPAVLVCTTPSPFWTPMPRNR